MKNALATLQRVRDTQKRGAQMELITAERERQKQLDRVEKIRKTMDRSRSGNRNASGDACWLAQEHQYRLQMELELRRESRALYVTEVRADERQNELRSADRASKVVENVIERIDKAAAIERRRADARRLDDIASSRWRRVIV